MVLGATILKIVKRFVYPVLEGMLDAQVEMLKGEIAEKDELSAEGKQVAYDTIDKLIGHIKDSLS